jgi:hypothetical protein
MSLFVDEQKKEHIHKSVGEILLERTGRVEKTELYTSSKELLMMYPNDYSLVIKEKNSRKHAEVTVYFGIGEVTGKFFKDKTNRKVRSDMIYSFANYLEKL